MVADLILGITSNFLLPTEHMSGEILDDGFAQDLWLVGECIDATELNLNTDGTGDEIGQGDQEVPEPGWPKLLKRQEYWKGPGRKDRR